MKANIGRSYKLKFIIIFLLVSFNLRMSFAAADPLLVFLMRDLNLSVGDSSLFGLLPIMSLGIAAPLGARLVHTIRPRLLIVYALLFAIIGVIWRSYGGITGLYSGTMAIGLGLGITGSVILGIVKQVFPHELPTLMGAYTACVSLGTSVGSGAADPIALLMGGWKNGLLFWALPLLLSVILWGWLICSKHPPDVKQNTLNARIAPLLKQRKAWDVSLFYLFRVAGAWLLTVWLATLMRRRGLPLVEAGLVLAVATACQIPSALMTNALSKWIGNRLKLLIVVIPLSVACCWALLEGALSLWPLFSAGFGLSIGCIFSIGMTLIVVNSADEASTVALSGMAQGLGFIAGGLLAWGASFGMNSPRADLWIGLFYTVFALSGLYFGARCERKGQVSTN
ncbi:MAG: MFS transporter [Akkermansia sp.]|nr:MFS transporter [Akkermansia sp.]